MTLKKLEGMIATRYNIPDARVDFGHNRRGKSGSVTLRELKVENGMEALVDRHLVPAVHARSAGVLSWVPPVFRCSGVPVFRCSGVPPCSTGL